MKEAKVGQPRLSDKIKVKTVLYYYDEPVFFVSEFSNELYLVMIFEEDGKVLNEELSIML